MWTGQEGDKGTHAFLWGCRRGGLQLRPLLDPQGFDRPLSSQRVRDLKISFPRGPLHVHHANHDGFVTALCKRALLRDVVAVPMTRISADGRAIAVRWLLVVVSSVLPPTFTVVGIAVLVAVVLGQEGVEGIGLAVGMSLLALASSVIVYAGLG